MSGSKNNQICVITTFPNWSWDVYAKRMLESFVQYWPKEIPLLVALDDDTIADQVQKVLNRPEDAIAAGWPPEHKAFVERNKDKDSKDDYRKQAVRFCHKIFAIKRALEAIEEGKKAGEEVARYLIWMDADVITNRAVTLDEIKECLPKDGDAVAYLGRKDWDHSECGWLAFDLEKGGVKLINSVVNTYISDDVFKLDQWHDSWVWDRKIDLAVYPSTNLTLNKPGMDIWPQSPMGKWSTHYKGPAAKGAMVKPKAQKQLPLKIQTLNALPNPEIVNNIRTNQLLIKNWIVPCVKTNEEIIVVSAGPTLVAEDVRKEAGKRIVAVKHALEPLAKAGITPWACILLDPRDHVAKFVDDADTSIIWIVASQVSPEVTRKLLEKGCTVWGYHASVGAGEIELTKKQESSIVYGGSATATRGLYVLQMLGFNNMTLYGYDLCFPDKPDLTVKDDKGQPKYLEVCIGMNHPLYTIKRAFWTEGQLVAQYEELNEIIRNKRLNLRAHGHGIIPFLIQGHEVASLRESELKAKLIGSKLPNYRQLLKCSKTKKTTSLGKLGKLLRRSRQPQTRAMKY